MAGGIRRAKFADITAIAALMRELYARSKYADLTLDIRLFKDTCIAANRIHGKTACLFVADGENGIEGFILGGTGPVYGFGKELFATDQIFYVTPGANIRSAVGLFRAFIEWFENSPPRVVTLQVAATDAVQDYRGVEALFKRHGLTHEGVLYSKRKLVA